MFKSKTYPISISLYKSLEFLSAILQKCYLDFKESFQPSHWMLTPVLRLPSFPTWQQLYTLILTGRWPQCQVPFLPHLSWTFPTSWKDFAAFQKIVRTRGCDISVLTWETYTDPAFKRLFSTFLYRLWLPIIISVIRTVALRKRHKRGRSKAYESGAITLFQFELSWCQTLARLCRSCETLEKLFKFSETFVLHRRDKTKCLLYWVLVKVRDCEGQAPCLP